ncbi:MAG TPA: ribulokinase [Rectinemataceae bacterium]
MKAHAQPRYVIGMDFGTDTCRILLVDADSGAEKAQAVSSYPRWAKGLYCSPAEARFRQHPLDYIEAMESAMEKLAAKAGAEALGFVRGIGVDTTGSTPCAVDASGRPLALLPEFAEDPDAMFVLWKDHTAIAEAEEINALARGWGGKDFTAFSGGSYSAEWFWAKALHVIRSNPRVAKAAASFLEHCDWMPALLTASPLEDVKRSRCAAGHKAMWHESFGGYPEAAFLERLHAALVPIARGMGKDTYTSDTVFGFLSAEWARRLGLKAGIPVAVGALDAHMGAAGSGAKPGVLVKVMGTSTCDMISAPIEPGQERTVAGICGQVDGSILPGLLGYEAGQSAFGDVYAWFKKLLLWPIESVLPKAEEIDSGVVAAVAEEMDASIMNALEKEAAKLPPGSAGLVALDWLNGRRTPDADQSLAGAIMGLRLGTTAPAIYRALIEATAFGTRAIVDRFEAEGVPVSSIVAIGGVARKSPLVVQIVSDVLGRPIDILGSDQSVALGAAMFASLAAGLHPDMGAAQAAMASAVERRVEPLPEATAAYEGLYRAYNRLGGFVEAETRRKA